MRGTEPGTARQEAERLVATAAAAAQLAAQAAAARLGHPARCVCPVCRTLAALRDPDPVVVERLATRAGDAAAGLAGLVRSAAGWRAPAPGPADEVWRMATRERHTGRPEQPPDDVWSAATRPAGDRPAPVRERPDPPASDPGPGGGGQPGPSGGGQPGPGGGGEPAG
jgi:hypothetical protein